MFFNHTPTTTIYTLSLHDALPISAGDHPPSLTRSGARVPRNSHTSDVRAGKAVRYGSGTSGPGTTTGGCTVWKVVLSVSDRKSTRLNSSHANISYAVFCLKKQIVI